MVENIYLGFIIFRIVVFIIFTKILSHPDIYGDCRLAASLAGCIAASADMGAQTPLVLILSRAIHLTFAANKSRLLFALLLVRS